VNLNASHLTVKPCEQNKVFKYFDPCINIGKGKYGTVDLILVKNGYRALKKIPKLSIESTKQINHLHTEKKILKMFKDVNFCVQLYETFTDE